MKIVGLITEYNPFHFGHQLHLSESKRITNADLSIAVMSGHFVQRGEPALVDKWHRAKMAIDSGVDLVFELPTYYASQSAEIFAIGSILILNALPHVSDFCFGSEHGNLKELKTIASLLVSESPEYKAQLKNSLNQGNSYPKARNDSLKAILGDFVEPILDNSNNILAIEYLKALEYTKSNLRPHTITRSGHAYNSAILDENICSATAIRKGILEHSLTETASFMPKSSYASLEAFLEKFKTFNHLNHYSPIINYLITQEPQRFDRLLDNESGLAQRFYKYALSNPSAEDLIQSVKTKRYTLTRLQRLLINLLLDTPYDLLKPLTFEAPQYLRLLGYSSAGRQYLNQVKKDLDIPVISNVNKHSELASNPFLNLDLKASMLYYQGINAALHLDKVTYPYCQSR